MTSVTVLPLAVYPAGTRQIPVTDVADDVTDIRASFQRCTSANPTVWSDPASTISYDFDLSFDGGNTWQDFIAGSDSGGITTNKLGQEITDMYLGDQVPPGTGRKLKGSVTFSANIRTSATVTVT
jgi:hypothetical protein